ncbi:MAG: carotenoid biosynthesis protein, partial [Caldilineaceae bacterium]
VGFGLLLEWATIQQLHAYSYGKFVMMLGGEVPVAIGIGWGVIIYSARLFGEGVEMPGWSKPVLAGLLALNIDLAMDAVAIRLGFWDWGAGMNFEYFGVPYPNFWAWFWVVFSFSVGLRWLASGESWSSRWLGPLGAIVVGVVGVLGTNWLITAVVPDAIQPQVVWGTLLVALFLVRILRPRLHQKELPAVVFWVPFAIHIFYLAAGLLSGAFTAAPFLLLASLAMLALALWLHGPTLRRMMDKEGYA